jgi:large subunit ribosomal protein L10
MNRQEKETVVSDLKESFASSTGLFLISYRGMSVAQLQRLRKMVRQNQGHLKVAKVRLVKRAIEGLPGSENLTDFLREQVALVFAEKESPAIAKMIYDFAKENEALKIVAGYIDASVYPASAVSRIATLPSREVLLGQLCGTLKAPMSRLVGLFSGMQTKLVMVVKQIEEQKKQ